MREIPKNSAPIIHEILEKLALVSLSSYEYKIIFAIFRKTYGWQKKEDWIAASQLSKMTNIPRPHVSRTLKKLLNKNIIYKKEKIIGINKNTKLWKLPIQVTIFDEVKNKKLPIQVTEVTYLGNEKLPIQVHTKEKHKRNYTKENVENRKFSTLKKISKRKKNKSFLKETFIAFHLYEEILKNDKNFKKPNFEKWAEQIEKIIRIDKRTPEQIDFLIHWTQNHDFWKSNILSPRKIRKHFTTLALQAKSEFLKQKKEIKEEREY